MRNIDLLRFIRPYKTRLVAGIGATISHSLVTVFFFKLFKDFLDTMIDSIATSRHSLRPLTLISLTLVGMFLFKGIAYYGQRYLTTYVAQRTMKDLREALYRHLQSMSMEFFDKNKVGQIMSRTVNDVAILEGAIVSGAINVFYNLITLVVGMGYLLYLNPKLTVLILAVFPSIVYVYRKYSRRIRGMSRRIQESVADINDVLHEGLVGIRIVKSFVREDYEFNRFVRENEANFAAHRKNAQLTATLSPMVELLASLGFTLVLWFGGYEVIRGTMTPGELIAFFTLALMIINPLKALSGLSHTVQNALAAADRIVDLLNQRPAITEIANPKELPSDTPGRVELRNVSFGYHPGELVLRDINLEIEPGETVALVGPSGAGKSTLADLIPRFYEVTSGEILVDGHDIKTLSLASLRQAIAVVPQETVLFAGSIYDNILYGNLGADREEVVAAAQAANAHGFISALEHGYDTIIGEKGVGLSGGQRQRIAIARALLKNPRILILDEATSALDTQSEALVQEALENLMRDRTTLVIAHRLSTIVEADKIVVLDRGQIVEVGTHQELLAKGGFYHRLYEGQWQEQ
ncbi:MAG: ABC transporter ATP-binding protein [Firmicutes bacterium]|nr:ABC transporter ATP-binding protein [Bacillota bacterium]